MKKQNKELNNKPRILAFCWDDLKLIKHFLNFTSALIN